MKNNTGREIIRRRNKKKKRHLKKWVKEALTNIVIAVLIAFIAYRGTTIVIEDVKQINNRESYSRSTKAGGLQEYDGDDDWENPEAYLHDNIDDFRKLKSSEWTQNVPEEEKPYLGQMIVNYESICAGMSYRIPRFETANLEDNVLGRYIDSENKIEIDETFFYSGPVTDIYNAIAHEVYHAAQSEEIRALRELKKSDPNYYRYRYLPAFSMVFEEINRYEEEFSDYINGSEDVRGYALQNCEVSARDWANKRERLAYISIDRL